MYIYQHPEWPNFTWDEREISLLLAHVRHQKGHLLGRMSSLGLPTCEEATLQTLTQEVVKSSEIEGELLDQQQVRSSVAKRLGIDVAGVASIDRNIEGVVEMMLDATQHYKRSLTKERLYQWHSLLFPDSRRSFSNIRFGHWRTGSVQVISGAPGKQVLHFEGPPARHVNAEMSHLLSWLNSEKKTDPVLMAAIAHLWFMTIHPLMTDSTRSSADCWKD